MEVSVNHHDCVTLPPGGEGVKPIEAHIIEFHKMMNIFSNIW
jgi:hypothetical protein